MRARYTASRRPSNVPAVTAPLRMTFAGDLLLLEMEAASGGVHLDVDPRAELATALVARGRVTFVRESLEPPLLPTWEERATDLIRELPLGASRGWTRSLSERLGFHDLRGLVCTRRPSMAASFFDGALFEHEPRTALVTPTDLPPPELDHTLLDALTGDAWTEAARSLGVLLAVRVDGPVASCWSTSATLDRLANDLEIRTWYVVNDFSRVPSVP